MANLSSYYDKGFYQDQQDGSSRSAAIIIPKIFEIYSPASVLDIGCGVGTWLKVFKEKHGVKEVCGVDGEYVNQDMLQISKDEFVFHNLEQQYTPKKKYDLAISMEVGEHLPETSADKLVAALTQASDFVMFSAALKGQTGTYHINEQYPEYWAKKFTDRGYVCIDHIRKQVWNNRDIEVWYRQNVLLFVKKDVFERDFKNKLGDSQQKTDPDFLTRIHPEMYEYFKGKFEQTKSFMGFVRFHLYPLKKMFGK